MNLTNPSFKVFINGSLLDPTKIEDLYVTSSLESTIPYGEIIYKDSDGLEFAKMRWPIGSDVEIVIYDVNKPEEEYRLCLMKLLNIFNPVDIDNSVLAGNLVLQLSHPWIFFQDFTDRAFGPQAGSDVIFNILDSSKVKQFFTNKDDLKNFIKDTDSSFQPPRYKCGESDLNFILNKIIPYSSINHQPALMFVTDTGKLFVNSWLGMFSEPTLSEGVVIVPDFTQIGNQVSKELKDSMAKGPIIWADDIDVQIGKDYSLAKQTYVKFYFDVSKASKTAIGDIRPQAAMGISSGKSVSNAIPMSSFLNLFGNVNTDSYILKNRGFVDEVALATNINSNLFDTFSVDITTSSFCGELMTIGNVAYLAWPNPSEGKEHWINGKWLITRTSYKLSPYAENELTTTITLTRPTFFIPNSDTTCIENLSLLQRC